MLGIALFQSFTVMVFLNQGRRASLRSALAPGYHISRRWRCVYYILSLEYYILSLEEKLSIV